MSLSPPLRGRGLKPENIPGYSESGKSPPLRGRGLKQQQGADFERYTMSPPLRGRGLKRARAKNGVEISAVAPPAGAWIETMAP